MAHHTSIALPAEQDARRPILTRSFGWGFVASFALHCNLYVLSVIMTTHCMERYGPTSPRRRSPPASSPSAAWGGRFLGGPVTDRLGLVPIAILGFSLTAASSLLYLVAGDIHAVIAIRLCHGLFYGVASTTVTSMASAQVPEERHGEGMGYFMLSVTLASAVGPLVGIALMGSANYAALLLLAAGLAAAGFASTLLCGPTAGQEELGRELEDLESLEPDAPPRWTSPPTACACCPRPRVSRGSSSSLCCPWAPSSSSATWCTARCPPISTPLPSRPTSWAAPASSSSPTRRPCSPRGPSRPRSSTATLMVPGFVALGAGIGPAPECD